MPGSQSKSRQQKLGESKDSEKTTVVYVMFVLVLA